MTDLQISKLNSLGVNLDVTLERFVGNEGLYFTCLRKFTADENYSNMKKAIKDSNVTDAFEYAHALKGVAANLGLDMLFEQMAVITEVFRAKSLDYSETNMKKIEEEYERAMNTLKEI